MTRTGGLKYFLCVFTPILTTAVQHADANEGSGYSRSVTIPAARTGRQVSEIETRTLRETNTLISLNDSESHQGKDAHSHPDNHQSEGFLKWSMSGLVSAGGSTVNASELERLQGGAHDPKKNGFTLQALALSVNAGLGDGHGATASIVSHIKPDGENIVELEQAFLQTKTYNNGLSAKAGQYYVEFGNEMTRHPDDWDFVDVPFLITRLFGGDKLRSQGVELKWQPPFHRHTSLTFGINNPDGETASSFNSEQGEEVGGYILQDRQAKKLDDMLYSVKWSHYSTPVNNHQFSYGASALFGPNASGNHTRTQIYGLNFNWKSFAQSHGHDPALNWHTELMYRNYEAGDKSDPNHDVLKDYGFFSQLIWRTNHNSIIGVRAGYADASSGLFYDAARVARKRLAISYTRALSSSLKWRLQFNHDRDDALADGEASSLWLQLVFQAGAHDEH